MYRKNAEYEGLFTLEDQTIEEIFLARCKDMDDFQDNSKYKILENFMLNIKKTCRHGKLIIKSM